MPVSSITNRGSVVQHGGTNNPAQQLAEQGKTVFSSTAKGAEAIIGGIQASSLKAHAGIRDLNASHLRGVVNGETSATNLLRASKFDPQAARFDPNTDNKLRRRIEVKEITSESRIRNHNVKPDEPIKAEKPEFAKKIDIS